MVPVVLLKPLLDHFFHNVIGHQLSVGHDAFDAGTELGVALDVPAKNVTDTDMHQIEGLLEQFGLSAFAAALHSHDDVLVHRGSLLAALQGNPRASNAS